MTVLRCSSERSRGRPPFGCSNQKKKQQPGSNKKKTVLDYNYERKAKDMKSFVDREMPEFIEHVANGPADLAKFEEKASKNGLPRAMLFTSKPNTSPISKFLSTEFRRRMLIAEIKSTKKNKDIIDKFKIEDFPALLVIPPPSNSTAVEEVDASGDSVIIRYPGKESKEFSKHRLITFLNNHALKDMVMPKRKEKEETATEPSTKKESKPEKKQQVKSEL